MKDLMKKMNNIRTLRVMAREATFAELELMLEKLSTVVEERREGAILAQAEQEQKSIKLKEYLDMLEQDGINPAELVSSAPTLVEKKPRKKVEPKYEWNENGEHKTWTGQGRKPKFIQNSLDQGMDLAQFAIGE